jgi:hypothetical protein
MNAAAFTFPAPRPIVSRLHCHASSPDPKVLVYNPDAKCASPIGHSFAPVRFVETAGRAPEQPDGRTWVRCSRCKTWNVFEAVSE